MTPTKRRSRLRFRRMGCMDCWSRICWVVADPSTPTVSRLNRTTGFSLTLKQDKDTRTKFSPPINQGALALHGRGGSPRVRRSDSARH